MRFRAVYVRWLAAVLFVALLIVPVGIERGGVPQPASVGESLFELASGRFGVGILTGLVAGGTLASSALVRMALAVFAAVAFWLAGMLEPQKVEPPKPPRRRRCSNCGGWVSVHLTECPTCGHTMWL